MKKRELVEKKMEEKELREKEMKEKELREKEMTKKELREKKIDEKHRRKEKKRNKQKISGRQKRRKKNNIINIFVMIMKILLFCPSNNVRKSFSSDVSMTHHLVAINNGFYMDSSFKM